MHFPISIPPLKSLSSSPVRLPIEEGNEWRGLESLRLIGEMEYIIFESCGLNFWSILCEPKYDGMGMLREKQGGDRHTMPLLH